MRQRANERMQEQSYLENDESFYAIQVGTWGGSSTESCLFIWLFLRSQNAEIVKDAEEYYRASTGLGRKDSWNLRDSHMVKAVCDLIGHRTKQAGRPAKVPSTFCELWTPSMKHESGLFRSSSGHTTVISAMHG